MYNILNELKSKLHIEYYLSSRVNGDNFGVLSEEHGINTNIMHHCEEIINNVINSINYAVERGEDRAVYIDNNTRGLFFQKLYIRTQILYGNELVINGASYSANRTYINKEDKAFGEITINFRITVPQTGDINLEGEKRNFLSLISHELNHAFEHYNRYFNGKESMIDKAERNGYFKNDAWKGVGDREWVVKMLSFTLYHLYNFEVNAYIAGTIQELRPELLQCDNSEEAWNIVKNSNIMRKYSNCGNFLEEITTCNDEQTRTELLNYYNSVRRRKVNSYETMIKILKKQFIKVRKQIVDRLSKQVTDIAMSSNQWGYLDGPGMNKTEI